MEVAREISPGLEPTAASPPSPQFENFEPPADLPVQAYMGHGQDRHVELTSENEHLSFYNARTRRHEVPYHHSNMVRSMLESVEEQRGTVNPRTNEPAPERPMAFRYKNGTFQDQAVLMALRNVSGKNAPPTRLKHVAHFGITDESGEPKLLSVPLNAIYAISLARPKKPHPSD